jgi:integrase
MERTEGGWVLHIRRRFYGGELEDRTKTAESERTVALTPSLARLLNEHRLASQYGTEINPIFASVTGGHQDAHNVRRRLRPAADHAGVPWVTPHVFRHTLATMLRDQGYEADVIAKVLGQTDEAFTRHVYIHANEAPRFDDLDDFALAVAG